MRNNLPIPVRPVCYPNVDAMQDGLRAGEIDAAFPVYSDIWFSERNGFYQTSPIVSDRVMVVYQGEYREDLFGKVAISRDSIGQRFYLSTYYPDAEILYCDSRKAYFDAVLEGSANCSIGSSSILYRYIAEHPEYNKLNVAFLDRSEEFGIVTNSDDAKLCEIIDKVAAQIDPAKITNAMIQHSNVGQAFSLKEFLRRYAVWFIGILCLFITGLIWTFISYRMRTVRHQREMQERFKIIGSLSRIYFCSYYIDVRNNSYTELTSLDYLRAYLKQGGKADEGFGIWVANSVDPDQQEKVLRFVDLADISLRMKDTDSISIEYYTHRMGWCQGNFIVVDRDGDGNILHAIWAARDINEEKENQRRTQSALESALESANAASEAKTTFLASMSHDIRTPMNAIIGMTAIAAAHLDDPAKVADCLGKITSSSKLLLGLINEVLDMSKIESGKVELAEKDFSLPDLIDSLITNNRPQILAKRHSLLVHTHQIVHERVYGDDLRLQQALNNLLSNAVKYTPDGGEIKISISERPSGHSGLGCFEFIIQDNGIGMSEEYLPHIFELFTRAEGEAVRKIQGTGLGMVIARNIVRMMDGDISVKSRLGEGTTFTVTVYLKLLDAEKIAYEELVNLNILVADDDPIACETTCALLSELGMRSEGVLSGEEAVEKITDRREAKQDYFAVILDWRMPGMDGVETAREIRRRVGAEMPIIVISAYNWSDIEQEAREAGVNAFIGKPLFKSRIAHVFGEIMGDREENRQNSLSEMIGQVSFAGKRVLLAEDNDLNAEIATEILGMTGIAVERAVNGQEALDRFREGQPGYYDGIFMDVQMPVMNGIEAAKAIRALPREDAGKIPILAMTANAFMDDVQAVMKAGMNAHIAKPLDMAVLLEMMKEYL